MEFTTQMSREEYITVWVVYRDYFSDEDSTMFKKYINETPVNHTKLLLLLTKACRARVDYNINEYKNAFTFLQDKLRVEVPVHPLDLLDIEFMLVLLNKLTFEGKDVQQVFTTSLKLQEEFKILKELQEDETKKFEK